MNLSQEQFLRLSDLVHAESGIHLHDGKMELLQSRLARRLRKTGILQVDAYIRRLERDPEELVAFLDAVSTNHTFFFRENHNLACLDPRHRKIWCAASSSGEEPYSIAIHCREMSACPAIWATDISTRVLAQAEKGIYPMERVKTVAPDLLKRYFQRGCNRWKDHVKVKDDIRRMVAFERFNLITDRPPSGGFDVIFCRNVLFYFDKETKRKVVDKLFDALRPGGVFVIGGAETLSTLRHRFRYVRPSIYHKPGLNGSAFNPGSG